MELLQIWPLFQYHNDILGIGIHWLKVFDSNNSIQLYKTTDNLSLVISSICYFEILNPSLQLFQGQKICSLDYEKKQRDKNFLKK